MDAQMVLRSKNDKLKSPRCCFIANLVESKQPSLHCNGKTQVIWVAIIEHFQIISASNGYVHNRTQNTEIDSISKLLATEIFSLWKVLWIKRCQRLHWNQTMPSSQYQIFTILLDYTFYSSCQQKKPHCQSLNQLGKPLIIRIR